MVNKLIQAQTDLAYILLTDSYKAKRFTRCERRKWRLKIMTDREFESYQSKLLASREKYKTLVTWSQENGFTEKEINERVMEAYRENAPPNVIFKSHNWITL